MKDAFWSARASREARRFNFGWWLQMFLPWVVGLGIVGSVAILALRSADRDASPVAIALGGLALVGVVVALLKSRVKFLSKNDALTRLDADLRLHNRLTSAAQGVGDWPAPAADATLALRWNWKALWWPPLVAMALVMAALVVPLPQFKAKAVAAKAEPPAWGAIQEKLTELRKEEVVQKEPVEEMQKALDALRKQPSDQWFRHDSLEAGDHLQSQLDQALSVFCKSAEISLGAMDAARQIEESQVQSLNQPLNDALNQALRNMEMGKLPLDEKLLAQMKNLDTSKIRQLSAEEFKALSDKLKEGAKAASGAGKYDPNGKPGEDLLAALMQQPGNGGVSRGPGAAPISLKDNETHLGTTKTEISENKDLSHAAMGDLMGLGTGKHKVDEAAYTGPQSGGSMSSNGSGGDAVWEQAATPAEQQALTAFFH